MGMGMPEVENEVIMHSEDSGIDSFRFEGKDDLDSTC